MLREFVGEAWQNLMLHRLRSGLAALGIIFGVLPGLGSVTALAVLVPITFYFSPLAAIAFLVGINKGGTSGGAMASIIA